MSDGVILPASQPGLPPYNVSPRPPQDKNSLSSFVHAPASDPRKKLLMNLQSSGLLSGEEDRKRKAKDIQDYPDITALANFAKTKDQFHQILGSPQASPSTSASGGSPDLDPRIDPEECPDFDLSIGDGEKKISAASPHHDGNVGCKSRSVDPERAELLWNLAGHGSPEVKPLGTLELETDGTTKTGVYLLSSPKMGPKDAPTSFQSIFKPLDEESFERRGIEVGMGALREEAAYVIDHASGGKACVPVTARVSIEERGVWKKGSVQKFVDGSLGPVEDFGMPRDLQDAEAMVTLDNVQAVACLDIRMFNTDRHTGNLLLAGGKPHTIICIDHGCVLPAWWALDAARFDAWLDWPHVQAPPSEATFGLVLQISKTLPRVTQELEKLGLPRQAIWTLEICTLLLQKCILHHGLSLRSIALLMTRVDPAVPSWLERKIEEACVATGIPAEFRPEGKYGDLVFNVDKRVINQFEEGSTTKNRLSFPKDAFFTFLEDAFIDANVVAAAKSAEDAMQPPWV